MISQSLLGIACQSNLSQNSASPDATQTNLSVYPHKHVQCSWNGHWNVISSVQAWVWSQFL